MPLRIIKRTAKTRTLFFLICDMLFIVATFYFAFLLRFEGQIPTQYFEGSIQAAIILALVFCVPIFYFSKLYHFTWAYVSTQELITLFKAVSLSFLVLGASLFVLRDFNVLSGFPRSVLLISYFLVFLSTSLIRFSKRIYLQIFSRTNGEGKERTIIVGAGDAGEQILRSILNAKESSYLPLGFIDDSPAKQGVIIHGLKVFGKIQDIPNIIKNETVDGLIIALPSVGASVIKEAVELARQAGIKKIKIAPSLSEIIDGRITVGMLREVEVQDLLGREEFSLDQNSIENFIKGKKVLITGAAGSIGSELCRQVAKFGPSQLFLLDQDETGIFNISEELKDRFQNLKIISLVMDIVDKIKIDQIFHDLRPEIVFHAAAYKHVPLMESEPEEAVKNNVFGTKILVEAAIKEGVEKFIFISTDKAINPASIMGATKRIGEMICQTFSNGSKFVSVRFGNVLDSRGSVIPIFREKIKKREAIEITHPEMKRYFMTTPEACLLVLQAGAMGQGGEVFVLDMGKPIKIIDLAKELIRLSGLEPDKDIPIVFTKPRPGEKFFEEILSAEEGVLATKNKKIFISRLSQVDRQKLADNLEKLKEAAQGLEREKIIKILKEIIPNYGKTI